MPCQSVVFAIVYNVIYFYIPTRILFLQSAEQLIICLCKITQIITGVMTGSVRPSSIIPCWIISVNRHVWNLYFSLQEPPRRIMMYKWRKIRIIMLIFNRTSPVFFHFIQCFLILRYKFGITRLTFECTGFFCWQMRMLPFRIRHIFSFHRNINSTIIRYLMHDILLFRCKRGSAPIRTITLICILFFFYASLPSRIINFIAMFPFMRVHISVYFDFLSHMPPFLLWFRISLPPPFISAPSFLDTVASIRQFMILHMLLNFPVDAFRIVLFCVRIGILRHLKFRTICFMNSVDHRFCTLLTQTARQLWLPGCCWIIN